VQETTLVADGTRRAIAFRIDRFDAIVEPQGYRSDERKAQFLGVSYIALWRLRNNRSRPSNSFIAAVCTALPQVPFGDLFEVVEVADHPRRAA